MIASLFLAGVAHAQSDETKAAARAAATQGVAAEEAGDWAQAIELFTRAEALVHAPPHLLHIARAEAKRGRLIAAQEAYLRITREDLAPSAPGVFVDAQAAANEELPALQKRIPSLKVVLEGGTGTVMLDGAPLEAALVGIAFPIDPGEHELSARGTGTRSAPVKIAIAEGRHEIARLVLEPSTTDEFGLPAQAEDASGRGSAEPSSGSNVPAYAAFGVGVAGLAVGSVMMMVNRGKRDDADALCPTGSCPESKRAEIEDLDASATSAATMSLVGFGVGIVGVGVGAVLLILGKASSKEPVRAMNGLRSFGLSGTF